MENSVSRPRQTLLLFETLCITTSCNTGLARVGVDVCNRERQTMLLRTLWKKMGGEGGTVNVKNPVDDRYSKVLSESRETEARTEATH